MVAIAVAGGDSDDDGGVPDNHERSFSDDWLPSWKLLKSSLLDEWNMRSTQGTTNKDKGRGVLPVAFGGVKGFTCYGCGKEGHKKGDPTCKAGKYDAHGNAPQDYKDRMAKKRKAEGGRGAVQPGKKDDGGGKKYCHAFNFGKGTCRYGAKCKFLHEKEGAGGGQEKMKGFTPQQNKLVTTLLSSAMKRTAAAIAKKHKQKLKKAKLNEKKEDDDDDEDYSSMLASYL